MKVIGVIVMWAMLAALVICAALWPLARHADRRGVPDGQVWGLPDGAKKAENARLIWVGAQKIDE